MWLQVFFYIALLIAFFVFMKLSDMQVNGKKVIKLKYRILIALIFPLLILLFILFGMFIVLIIVFGLTILGLIFLVSIFKFRRR